MPQKIKPTGSQKTKFYIHFVIFAIATIAMVMIHRNLSAHHWVYPLHAWFIAAWALALLGHGCAVFGSYDDPGMDEYHRQENNG
jgi:hypothetical protein